MLPGLVVAGARRPSGLWVPYSGHVDAPPPSERPRATSNIHAAIGAFNNPVNSGTDVFGFRFVPDYTGTISTIALNIKTATGGYGLDTNGDGDFGTIRVQVFAMSGDGSSGSQLGNTFEQGCPSETTNGGVIQCTGMNVPVVAGTAYNLEVRNPGGSTSEFFSINSCHVTQIGTDNKADVTTNPDYPARTAHGLDPRTATRFSNSGGAFSYGAPSDSDGHVVPAYWLMFSDGHEEGQPYYYGTRSYTLHTSRTYTVPYDCVVDQVMLHGGGRSPTGGINLTADVEVNGVQIASGIALIGDAYTTASLGLGDVELDQGDTVAISISNTTNIGYPAFDAAMLSLVGGTVKNVLPTCLIG